MTEKNGNLNSDAPRFSGRRGNLPPSVLARLNAGQRVPLRAAENQSPENVISNDIIKNDMELEKIKKIHRPLIQIISFIVILGIVKSNFFEIAAGGNIYDAIEYSSVFPFEGDYGEVGEDYIPTKWFLAFGIIIIFGAHEFLRGKTRNLRSSNASLKRQLRLLKATYQPEYQKVLERFEIAIAECPKCGRSARVQASSTILVTCGGCGEKWTSGPTTSIE